MGSRVENVRSNNFLSALPNPQGLGPLFSDVSKKQTVDSTKEEPSLVRFMLKLNLLYLMSKFAVWKQNYVKFYCCGLPRVEQTGSFYNQETKPVAGREALLTILAKINELELPAHRFVRELVLVLYINQYAAKMRRRLPRRVFDLGDEEAVREDLLARKREARAKIRKYMMMLGMEAKIKEVTEFEEVN